MGEKKQKRGAICLIAPLCQIFSALGESKVKILIYSAASVVSSTAGVST